MRCLFLSAMTLSALTAAALTVDVRRLPAPAFADGEVSGDAVLPANRLDKLNVFRLEMSFESTPSNNVQVAFGRDNRPADGALAAEETDFIIGWDCGEWFLRPKGLRERHVFTPQDSTNARPRTLTVEIRVNGQGVPQSAVFADRGGEGAFTFPDLTLTPVPDWLRPGLWTDLRVTLRGGATNETVSARFMTDGSVILIQ